MLTFIGLGLYDERSITVEGREALRSADRVFEFYTSRLVGADVDDLEAYHDTEIEVRAREGVEQDPGDPRGGGRRPHRLPHRRRHDDLDDDTPTSGCAPRSAASTPA